MHCTDRISGLMVMVFATGLGASCALDVQEPENAATQATDLDPSDQQAVGESSDAIYAVPPGYGDDYGYEPPYGPEYPAYDYGYPGNGYVYPAYSDCYSPYPGAIVCSSGYSYGYGW
jgi:hypothetical protein